MPANIGNSDVRGLQDRVTDAIATALRSAGITHVVTLSSIGADKTEKTGPVIGLHKLEQQLNGIEQLNVLHLRAGYFMENTLAQIGIIRSTGMTLGPLWPDLKLPMLATQDIGEAAASALLVENSLTDSHRKARLSSANGRLYSRRKRACAFTGWLIISVGRIADGTAIAEKVSERPMPGSNLYAAVQHLFARLRRLRPRVC